MNIPNWLTFMRIGIIPFFVIIFYLPFGWANKVAAILFLISCVTDWLDGYLARKWEQTSSFGAFLDPVADKLSVAVALVLLVGEKNIPYLAIPAAIIVCREIIISSLREWMAELGRRTSIAVNMVGKAKTLMQMAALCLLIAYRPLNSWLGVIGYIMIYIAAVLTVWSMFVYLKLAWPDLIKNS